MPKNDLGGWMVRCNPKKYDLRADIASGGVTNWRVTTNFKQIKQGDRVIVWMTGATDATDPVSGIWGIGHVTKAPYTLDGTEPDNNWLDPDAAAEQAQHKRIGIEVAFLDPPLSRAELKNTPGLEDLLILGNPRLQDAIRVAPHHMKIIQQLIRFWPAPPPPAALPSAGQIAGGGAGFGDAAVNAKVEAAAMNAVTAHYKSKGWETKDVSADKLGWDITCSRDDEKLHVEVKGISGSNVEFLLTRNEYRTANKDKAWRLAAVTNALTDPHITELDAATVVKNSTPFTYRYKPSA